MKICYFLEVNRERVRKAAVVLGTRAAGKFVQLTPTAGTRQMVRTFCSTAGCGSLPRGRSSSYDAASKHCTAIPVSVSRFVVPETEPDCP